MRQCGCADWFAHRKQEHLSEGFKFSDGVRFDQTTLHVLILSIRTQFARLYLRRRMGSAIHKIISAHAQFRLGMRQKRF